jgi:hypothetical protein
MTVGSKITISLQPEDAEGNKLNFGPFSYAIFSQVNGQWSVLTDDNKYGIYSAVFSDLTAGIYTFKTILNGELVTSEDPTVTVTSGPANITNSTVTVSELSVQVGTLVTVTLKAVDDYGNLEAAGLAIAFMLGSGSGKGTFGKVSYAGNGIYQATFTATKVGSNTLEALIGGVKFKSTATILVTPA